MLKLCLLRFIMSSKVLSLVGTIVWLTLLAILAQWLGRRTVYWQRLKMLSNVGKVYLMLGVLVTWHIFVLKRDQKNSLSLNVEDMIIDIYCHFHRSIKRKCTLTEYMECTITHIKKFIKHVSKCWLSVGKCLDRT